MAAYTITIASTDASLPSAVIQVEPNAGGKFRIIEYAVRPGNRPYGSAFPLLDRLVAALVTSDPPLAASIPGPDAVKALPPAEAAVQSAPTARIPSRRTRPPAPRAGRGSRHDATLQAQPQRVNTRSGGPARVMPDEFPAAYAQTTSKKALAEAFGVPDYTVRYWIQKLGRKDA